MRKIMTNAALFFQYLEHRRGHRRRLGIELEFVVDAVHQRLDGFEQRARRRKAGTGVSGKLVLDANVRRFKLEAIDLQQYRRGSIGQSVTRLFPGRRIGK